MDFAFKLFEPKRKRQRDKEPAVEVKASGRIVFNRPAVEMLDGRSYCKLGFDAANAAIGVLPVEEHDLNSFSIRYTAKGAYVGAKRFLQHYGIIPAGTIRIMPQKSGDFIGCQINQGM